MFEAIDYVIDKTVKHEYVLKRIIKANRRQDRINFYVAGFLGILFFTVRAENKKIEGLSKEIEELKCSKENEKCDD